MTLYHTPLAPGRKTILLGSGSTGLKRRGGAFPEGRRIGPEVDRRANRSRELPVDDSLGPAAKLQRFGEMFRFDGLAGDEIRNRAGDAQDPVESTRGQTERAGGSVEQRTR